MSDLTKEQEERLACVLHGHYTKQVKPVKHGDVVWLYTQVERNEVELLLRRCRNIIRQLNTVVPSGEARLTIEAIDEQLLKL